MHPRLIALLPLLVLGAVRAEALTVLTVGKVAVFRDRSGTDRDGGLVRFGRDRAFAVLLDPTCPATSSFQVGAYPTATARVVAQPVAELACANWRAARGGYVYEDPAAAGGVRRIVYQRAKLVVELGDPNFTPVAGPLGYLQVWFQIGDTRFHGRFHDFTRNEPALVATRKPSAAAAAGEAAFWDVLTGDDRSREEDALRLLARAARRGRRDGRSLFLLAMMHMYRFGQATTAFATASDFGRAEIAAADDAFTKAVPLLWDGVKGDSRVPGFAAAARYTRGVVEGNAARIGEGLAQLEVAFMLNPFFNVFDYVPVAQAVPALDPQFGAVFGAMSTYLSDPEIFTCVVDQPEICGNGGLAPTNIGGALTQFGDLYAKAGDAGRAQMWYTLARALAGSGWRFRPILDERIDNLGARIAAYQDADPANDPPFIGAGQEACAVCHDR